MKSKGERELSDKYLQCDFYIMQKCKSLHLLLHNVDGNIIKDEEEKSSIGMKRA